MIGMGLCSLTLTNSLLFQCGMDSSLMLAEDPVKGGIEYKGSGKWVLDDNPGIGADFYEESLSSMETVILQ